MSHGACVLVYLMVIASFVCLVPKEVNRLQHKTEQSGFLGHDALPEPMSLLFITMQKLLLKLIDNTNLVKFSRTSMIKTFPEDSFT